jgi:catechol 2,3-dioxygenase-like lactoylglutathione lyase family enzyme
MEIDPLEGAAMTGTASRTHVTHVGTVIVPVTDQDRALEFFVDRLGFEKRADTPYRETFRWVEVAPPGATTTLSLIPPNEGETVGIDTHISFATDDVDVDHEQLSARGVATEEILRVGGPVPPMFFFLDPDGNRYLIVERE